jgi:hypothetical protein
MKVSKQSGWLAAAVAMVCLGLAGCGNNVKGHTYAGPDGSVKIEFQSGGTATVSLGPIASTCTYTQNGKQVNLVCEGDTEVLTMASDGSLSGPPEGMLAHLTKVK